MAGKGCGYTVAELAEARVFRNEEQGTTQLQHRDRCARFERAGIPVFFGNGNLSFFSEPGSRQVRHRQGGIIGGGHLLSPWLCGRIFLLHIDNPYHKVWHTTRRGYGATCASINQEGYTYPRAVTRQDLTTYDGPLDAITEEHPLTVHLHRCAPTSLGEYIA